MKQPIHITAISSISPLGFDSKTIWENYMRQEHFFTKKECDWVALLPENAKAEIEALRLSNSKYKQLDDSVLFAIYASRNAIKQADWTSKDNFGINIGSSRGATSLFEKYHQDFLQNNTTHTLSSPTTTLGNISSWVAHDLQTKGPEISHSITCSTALHAMINGIAWLQAGLTDKFLVGGSEAPLTPFTIAQMQALKVYCKSEGNGQDNPCRSLDFQKKSNTMILGEGASVACLELSDTGKSLAKIIGFGYGTEVLQHNASLSTDAECFQRSMQMALTVINPSDIDVIVTHTPGTIKGDLAEFNAIKSVFCNKMPALTTNKSKVGHSLGASGLLSIEMAALMLNHQTFIDIPYLEQSTPKEISTVLVNAVGFGGNAVSILLSK